MNGEFWDFTINFGDVLLAFVGVGGGAYTGSRAIQTARHRADVRMRLYDNVIVRISTPPSIVDYEVESEFDRAERNYQSAISTAVRLVSVLPVPERVLWSRFARELGESAVSSFENRYGPDRLDRRSKDIPTLRETLLNPEIWPRADIATSQLGNTLSRGAAEDRVLLPERAEPLLEYLSLHIRPGLLRRPRRLWTACLLRLAAARRYVARARSRARPARV
ncbi:hypothetical protein YM304_38820 [Ilumatobacter coccineus YM16-304]|uniref:Uncharacterized protein n=1 Tax=Ilumatobacter coccineus (strain NBRC 103263 / KCTC 29153 / YM16-304) TaxID=1313172 RepID=A0A6C7EJR6_ILUCY|nr:hypothetical protein YM304_38820 [Ilumatobacter coccineus YM16-304]